MYLDAFINKLSIENNEPKWLADFRVNSLEHVKTLNFEPDPNLSKYSDSKEIFKISIGDSEQIQKLASNVVADIDSVKIVDINDAVYKNPKLKKMFESFQDYDSTEASINACFRSGLYLSVPDNYKSDIPIQISAKVVGGLAVDKTFVDIGKSSHVKIIYEINGVTDNPAILLQNLNFIIGTDSTLDLYAVQTAGPHSSILLNYSINSFGKLNSVSVYSGGQNVRSRLKLNLMESGAEGVIHEAFAGSGNTQFDVLNKVNHIDRNTTSMVTSRAILNGSAKVVFKGVIRQEKEAVKSYTNLSEHSLLLSKDAKSTSIPSLEIETNDVRASHSASSHTIGTDEKFYLMSSGLSERKAANTIALGFLNPILSRIANNMPNSNDTVEQVVENIMI